MIRDEREGKLGKERKPQKFIEDRWKTLLFSRVRFKSGRGEKYPRTVSQLFVEVAPCRDSFGERCTLVQREIGRGIFTRRSRLLLLLLLLLLEEELEHRHQYRCIRDYPAGET